jgi:hypothetical protein
MATSRGRLALRHDLDRQRHSGRTIASQAIRARHWRGVQPSNAGSIRRQRAPFAHVVVSPASSEIRAPELRVSRSGRLGADDSLGHWEMRAVDRLASTGPFSATGDSAQSLAATIFGTADVSAHAPALPRACAFCSPPRAHRTPVVDGAAFGRPRESQLGTHVMSNAIVPGRTRRRRARRRYQSLRGGVQNRRSA